MAGMRSNGRPPRNFSSAAMTTWLYLVSIVRIPMFNLASVVQYKYLVSIVRIPMFNLASVEYIS